MKVKLKGHASSRTCLYFGDYVCM